MSQYSMNSEWELKKLIIEIGRRIWIRGYVAANDGNITVKMNKKEILTTPTGVSKGFMTPEMIIRMTTDGKIVSKNSKYKPSSEVKMHLEVYQQRTDIGSVIHAHPAYCTGFAVSGIPLDKCVLPEAILTIGAVPLAEYATPSTMEIPESIRPHIQNSDVVLLANHGALTLGPDLLTAYHRMETLEHAANIVFLSMQLGNVNVLPQNQVDRLMAMREGYGLTGKVNVCRANPATQASIQASDADIQKITQQVIERLKKS